jgi:hypothetical protein
MFMFNLFDKKTLISVTFLLFSSLLLIQCGGDESVKNSESTPDASIESGVRTEDEVDGNSNLTDSGADPSDEVPEEDAPEASIPEIPESSSTSQRSSIKLIPPKYVDQPSLEDVPPPISIKNLTDKDLGTTSPQLMELINTLRENDSSGKPKVNTLDELLRILPDNYTSRVIAVHHSAGLLPSSYDLPRLVIPSIDATFGMTFSGDRNGEGSQKLEVMDVLDADTLPKYNFFEMRFHGEKKGSSVQINPERCFQCHGPKAFPKYVFDPEPAWRGVYFGQIFATHGSKDETHFNEHVKKKDEEFNRMKSEVLDQPDVSLKILAKSYFADRGLDEFSDYIFGKIRWGMGFINVIKNKEIKTQLTAVKGKLSNKWADADKDRAIITNEFLKKPGVIQQLFDDVGFWSRYKDAVVTKSNQFVFDSIDINDSKWKYARYHLISQPNSDGPREGSTLETFVQAITDININRIKHMILSSPEYDKYKFSLLASGGCTEHFKNKGPLAGEGIEGYIPPAMRQKFYPRYETIRKDLSCNFQRRTRFLNDALNRFNGPSIGGMAGGGATVPAGEHLDPQFDRIEYVAALHYLINSRPTHRTKHFEKLSTAFEFGANKIGEASEAGDMEHGMNYKINPAYNRLTEFILKELRDAKYTPLIAADKRVPGNPFDVEFCTRLKKSSLTALQPLVAAATKADSPPGTGKDQIINDPLIPNNSDCATKLVKHEQPGAPLTYSRRVESRICGDNVCIPAAFTLILDKDGSLINLISEKDIGLKKRLNNGIEEPLTSDEIRFLRDLTLLAGEDTENPMRKLIDQSWDLANLSVLNTPDLTLPDKGRGDFFFNQLKKGLLKPDSNNIVTKATATSVRDFVVQGAASTTALVLFYYLDTRNVILGGRGLASFKNPKAKKMEP